MIEKVLSIEQEARNMDTNAIDIGHDKGLDVLYVTNEPIEIADIGQDKGQSVLYNTIADAGNEDDDKGQSEQLGIRQVIKILLQVKKQQIN